MTKATLVILRHGQTEYNKQHLMTGQRDVPLTEVGEDQARAAGALVSHIRFDKVYSSHLSRAFNTAALAMESSTTQMHLLNEDGTWQIEQREAIAEMHAGDFTGRSHKTDPEIIQWVRQHDVPLPGGESEKQVVERVQRFFDEDVLPRLQKGENVLIVAHAGILRMFDIVLGIEEPSTDSLMTRKRRIPNAAPHVYEYEHGVMTGSRLMENPRDSALAVSGKKPGQGR